MEWYECLPDISTFPEPPEAAPPVSSSSVRLPDDEVFFGACGAFDDCVVVVVSGVVGEFVVPEFAPDVRLF